MSQNNIILSTRSGIEYTPKCAEYCKKGSNNQICERGENCNNFRRLHSIGNGATANALVSDLLNNDIY